MVIADPGSASQRKIKILCDDEPVVPEPVPGAPPFTPVEFVPAGTVLDGEVVVMVGSRVDFPALQRRLTSHRVADPAYLVVLADAGGRGTCAGFPTGNAVTSWGPDLPAL